MVQPDETLLIALLAAIPLGVVWEWRVYDWLVRECSPPEDDDVEV